MPLFADNEVAASASVIACLLAAITGLFSWLGQRDKLRFDARMAQLEMEVKASREQHQDCEENQGEMKLRIDAQSRQIDSQNRQIDELRRRIDDLTGHHRPLPPAAA